MPETFKPSNSRKTVALLFCATLFCTVSTTLFSMWFFHSHEAIGAGRSPYSLFVVIAGFLIAATGPRLFATYSTNRLAHFCLIGVFAGVLLILAVPSWAFAGSAIATVANTFLEVIVYRSLLIFPNAVMRKVFVVATVAGTFAGLCLPLDTKTTLFAAPMCMALALIFMSPYFEDASHQLKNNSAPPTHIRRQLILKPWPVAGLIILAFVAHLASTNATMMNPVLTGGAYAAALIILWLSAIIYDDTSHIALIRCLILISTIVCTMHLAGIFGIFTIAFAETVLGIVVWTGIVVVALDLATYAEVPFSVIMGGMYLLLTGPAALIYLLSLAAPSLDTILFSSLADTVVICLLVFCALYLLNEQSLDRLFWGSHHAADTKDPEASPDLFCDVDSQDNALASAASSASGLPSLTPSSDKTVTAITRLATEAQLTAREKEVLELLSEGRSAPFIAEYLHIERSTAKTHIARIYTKLSVHTRQELISLVLIAKSSESPLGIERPGRPEN